MRQPPIVSCTFTQNNKTGPTGPAFDLTQIV